MPQKNHTIHRMVEYAYCDHRGAVRLSWLLAAAQQASMEHCTAAGIGDSYFRDKGLVFLLAKLSLDIPQMPMGGQELALFTQPNLPYRAQYRRITNFSAPGGTLLAAMDARWVLVDIHSRKLLRKLPDGVEFPFLAAEELPDLRPLCPGELTPCEQVTVRFSMLDVNGHMNNAVYGDLVCNVLEPQLMTDRRLRKVEVFYHREARLGDVIALATHLADDRFFIRGTIGDMVCFEAAGTLLTVP